MRTLTADDMKRAPQQLIDDARVGQGVVVTVEGEQVLMTVPLRKGIESQAVRLEFDVHLYDSEQISLGLAARIAGLSYGEMVDELGWRGIAVVRYGSEGLDLLGFFDPIVPIKRPGLGWVDGAA